MSFVRRTSSVPGRAADRSTAKRARNQIPPELAMVHAAVCKPKAWWEARRRQYTEVDHVALGITNGASVVQKQPPAAAEEEGFDDPATGSPTDDERVVEAPYDQVSLTSMSDNDDGLDADGMDHQSVATTATAATLGEGGLGMSNAAGDYDIANTEDVMTFEQNELDQARNSFNMSECSFQDDGNLGVNRETGSPTPPDLVATQNAPQTRMPSALLGSTLGDDPNHDNSVLRTSADVEEEHFMQEVLWSDINRRMIAMGNAFDPAKVGELEDLAAGRIPAGGAPEDEQLTPYEAAEELYILDQSNPCQFMPISVANFAFGFLWPYVGDQTALPYFVHRYQRLWSSGQSHHHLMWAQNQQGNGPQSLIPQQSHQTPVRGGGRPYPTHGGSFVPGSEEAFRHRSEMLPEGFSPPPLPSNFIGGFSPVVVGLFPSQFANPSNAPVVGGNFQPPAAAPKKPSVFALAKARMALHDRVKGVLNKVSGDDAKYVAVLQELQALPGLDSAEGDVLERVVDVFFAKAISEPQFSYRYAQLVRDLCSSSLQRHQQALADAGMNVLSDDEKKALQEQLKKSLSNRMRVSLIKKCQSEFESKVRLNTLIALNEEREELEISGGGEADALIDSIEKEKSRLLGLVQFVGELYNCSLLTPAVIQAVILGLSFGCTSLAEVRRLEESAGIDYSKPQTIVLPHEPNQYEVDQLLLLLRTVLSGQFLYTNEAAKVLPKVVYACWYIGSLHSVRRTQCIAQDILSALSAQAGGIPSVADALTHVATWGPLEYPVPSRSRSVSAPPTTTAPSQKKASDTSGASNTTSANRRTEVVPGAGVTPEAAPKPPLAPPTAQSSPSEVAAEANELPALEAEPKSPFPMKPGRLVSSHSSVRTNSPVSNDSASTTSRKRLKQKKKERLKQNSQQANAANACPPMATVEQPVVATAVPEGSLNSASQFTVLRRPKSYGGGSSCGEGTFEDDRTSVTSTATSGTAISCYSSRSRPLPNQKYSAAIGRLHPGRSLSLDGPDGRLYRRDADTMSETGSAISGGTMTNPLVRTNSGPSGWRPPSPPPLRPMRLIPMLPEASQAAVQCVGGYAMQLLNRCQAARSNTDPQEVSPEDFDKCLDDMCRSASLHTPEALLRSVSIWLERCFVAARSSSSFFDSVEFTTASPTSTNSEDATSIEGSTTPGGGPSTPDGDGAQTLHHNAFSSAVQGFVHAVVRRRSSMLGFQYDAEDGVGAAPTPEGRSPEKSSLSLSKGALVRASGGPAGFRERSEEDIRAFVQQVQSICLDLFNIQLAKAIVLDEEEAGTGQAASSTAAVSSALSSGSVPPRNSSRPTEVQKLFRVWAALVGCDASKTILHDGLHNGAFRLVLEAFLIPPGSSYRLQFTTPTSSNTLNASGSYRVMGSDTASMEGAIGGATAQYSYSCASGWRDTLGIHPSSPHRNSRANTVVSPPGSALSTKSAKHTTIAPQALIDAACKNKTPRAALCDLVPEANLSAVSLFVLEAYADPDIATTYLQHVREYQQLVQRRAATASSTTADYIQHASALLMSMKAPVQLQLQSARHRQPMEEGSFGRFRVLSELVRFRCEAWTEVFRTCSVPSRPQDTFEVAITLSLLQERANIQLSHNERYASRPGTSVSYLAPPIAVDPEILTYLGLLLGPQFVKDQLTPPTVDAFLRGSFTAASPVFPRGSATGAASAGLVFGGRDSQTKATVGAVFEQLRTHPGFKYDVSVPAKVHSGILHAEVTTRTPIGMMLHHSILLLHCVIDSVDRVRRELALVAEVFCGQQGLPAKEQPSPSVGPQLLTSLKKAGVITGPSIERASTFFRSPDNLARFMFFSGSVVLSEGGSAGGHGVGGTTGRSRGAGGSISSGPHGGRHSPTSSVVSSSLRMGVSRELSAAGDTTTPHPEHKGQGEPKKGDTQKRGK